MMVQQAATTVVRIPMSSKSISRLLRLRKIYAQLCSLRCDQAKYIQSQHSTREVLGARA
jgi:RNA processing factor Prp31